ncbi:MAG TPA: hypothetical protein VGD69_26745 [Herpetosiphonaceae bacterium]
MITIRRWLNPGLRYWRQSSFAQQVLFVAGSALFVSMIVHGLLLVATGGTIEGPVSLRKTMTFAETGWLLTWSVGWLLPLVSLRRWERWLLIGGTLQFAVGETFLMSLQVWRGVPSHYNMSTPFDAAVFTSTGVGALIVTVTMAVLLRAALRPSDLAPSLRLAIQGGALIMLIGFGTGLLMILNSGGIWQGADHFLEMLTRRRYGGYNGPAAGTIGGDLVLLHALGVHGLQIVPLPTWLLTYTALDERRRYRLTALVTASYLMLIAILAVQVFRELPLSALDLPTLTALLLAAVLFLGSHVAVGLALLGAKEQGENLEPNGRTQNLEPRAGS